MLVLSDSHADVQATHLPNCSPSTRRRWQRLQHRSARGGIGGPKCPAASRVGHLSETRQQPGDCDDAGQRVPDAVPVCWSCRRSVRRLKCSNLAGRRADKSPPPGAWFPPARDRTDHLGLAGRYPAGTRGRGPPADAQGTRRPRMKMSSTIRIPCRTRSGACVRNAPATALRTAARSRTLVSCLLGSWASLQ
jgi:hypothetical protein